MIKKVDKMMSMSDMKYDAIVKSGIEIWKRYDIPDEYYIFGWLYSCTSPSMLSVIRSVYLADLASIGHYHQVVNIGGELVQIQ